MRSVVVLLAALGALPAPRRDCPTAQARTTYRDGRKLLMEGDASAAVEQLSMARAECPAPAVDFYLALAYERLGRLSLAIDALEKYLAAPVALDNRVAVRAWVDELRTRAEAERVGVPPPSLPARAPPSPPPPYSPDEAKASPGRAARAPTLASPQSPDRWLFIASGGVSINGALQPGQLSGHDGAVARYGGSYQIGLAYRVSQRARLDLAAIVGGQILPWSRRDGTGGHDALFATVIALGLRADLPLAGGARTRLYLAPSVMAGLGSVSLDLDPSYQNAVALRFGLALAVERGTVGVFLEPQSFLFTGGDLLGWQWTAGADLGVRVRF